MRRGVNRQPEVALFNNNNRRRTQRQRAHLHLTRDQDAGGMNDAIQYVHDDILNVHEHFQQTHFFRIRDGLSLQIYNWERSAQVIQAHLDQNNLVDPLLHSIFDLTQLRADNIDHIQTFLDRVGNMVAVVHEFETDHQFLTQGLGDELSVQELYKIILYKTDGSENVIYTVALWPHGPADFSNHDVNFFRR